MRISTPIELLVSSAFLESRMALQNPNIIAARSLTPPGASHRRNNESMGHQRPIVDLLVAMIAVPILILCALQLEKNLHDMASSPESRWLVFALGIGMLIVSVIICGYVTHRMGVCIWAGPIDEAGNRLDGRSVPHINSQNDILRIVDSMPPSYESVVKFDLQPPSYDCLVIDMDQRKEEQQATQGPAAATAVNIYVNINGNGNATANANANPNAQGNGSSVGAARAASSKQMSIPADLTTMHI